MGCDRIESDLLAAPGGTLQHQLGVLGLKSLLALKLVTNDPSYKTQNTKLPELSLATSPICCHLDSPLATQLLFRKVESWPFLGKEGRRAGGRAAGMEKIAGPREKNASPTYLFTAGQLKQR